MKLVLTGGPSGGKTTLAMTLQKEFQGSVFLVPEAASILFAGGWPRRKSLAGVKHQQKAIYTVQYELEALLGEENIGRLIICDRGSLDGIAYWPGENAETEYMTAINSSIEQEIKRYDWVIHLDTAPEAHYDVSNPLRHEDFHEAQTINQRVKDAWAKHPQRFIVNNQHCGHFIKKISQALSIVELILEGKAYEEIKKQLGIHT